MITLIHTAESHVPRFDGVAREIGLDIPLQHVVREDWLARAQGEGDPTLGPEIIAVLRGLGGRMLCTCTTILPWAEQAGALRIDGPMADEAARIGGRCLMAYCLDSTLEPSLAILRQSFADHDKEPDIEPLDLTALWPLFMQGREAEFAQGVAGAVRDALTGRGDVDCVVLAQASMCAAAPLVGGAVPVLASPQMALRALAG